MRRTWWGALLVMFALMVAIPNLAFGETRVTAAGEPRQAVEAQVVIDGNVVGRFTEVSGLDIAVEQVATVCRKGDDNDCDDLEWGVATLRASWQVASVLAELESSSWLTTRAKHDMAKSAIRNLKAIVRQVETTLTDPAATMKTKHDTVKNSINNVRLVVTVLNETAASETGVDQVALGRLAAAVRALEALDSGWALRYRPGRPVYGNITLEGARGSSSGLAEWYQEVLDGKVDRKSGSIILLDRSGAEVARYNFYEAWPCRYSATLAIERIELAVEKVERVTK
jgi:hypothetical protein